jgi:hypothetical protein
MRHVLLIALASSLGWSLVAFAEPPPGGYDQTQNVQYNDPNAPPPPPQGQAYDQQQYPPQAYDQQQYPPQAYDQQQYPPEAYGQQPYPQQPAAQQAPPPEQTAYTGRGLQYGATLFVPLWLGDINADLRPGIGIHGRVGWELGRGLSIEGGIGWMGNRYEFYSGTQSNVFFTGGLRYAFLNPTALVPFVHAELQVNLWDYCYDDGFGGSVCSGFSDVTVGVLAGAGLIWEINYNVSLELGLNYSGTSAGQVRLFNGHFQSWLSPFVGVTLYF